MRSNKYKSLLNYATLVYHSVSVTVLKNQIQVTGPQPLCEKNYATSAFKRLDYVCDSLGVGHQFSTEGKKLSGQFAFTKISGKLQET